MICYKAHFLFSTNSSRNYFSEDIELIRILISQLKKPSDSRIYALERKKESAHAKIMKYNLNSKIS